MSAYEGEFIYLFQHYFSSDSMSIRNLLTVGNIAQKKTKKTQPKDVTVNWKNTLWRTSGGGPS